MLLLLFLWVFFGIRFLKFCGLRYGLLLVEYWGFGEEGGGSEVVFFVSKIRDNWYGMVKVGVLRFCGCDEGFEVFIGSFFVFEFVINSNVVFFFKNNSLERVVDWIFSYIDDFDVEVVMDISEGRLVVDFIFEFVLVGFKVRDGFGSECFWETIGLVVFS